MSDPALDAAVSAGLTDVHARRVALVERLVLQVARDRYGAHADVAATWLARARADGPEAFDPLAAAIAETDVDALEAVLRTLTAYFHLVNKAEQIEIIRVNRQRAMAATAEAPRGESIAEAVATLKAQGRTAEEALALIGRLDIQPTLTAHPTEARRRTILLHQQAAAEALDHLTGEEALTPAEAAAAEAEALRRIRLLFATDEVRPGKVTVRDEIRNGLYFVATTIWDVVPEVHADLRRAVRQLYGTEPGVLPPVLRYRSWIGGDRDGNPNVTAEVTEWTLRAHREDALRLHRRGLTALRLALSVSDRQADLGEALHASVEADREAAPLPERRWRQNAHEPVRLKLMQMAYKLDRLIETLPAGDSGQRRQPGSAPVYDAAAYRADLDLIADTLRQAGLADLADAGPLADARVRATTFGFHLAALDLRQHSRLHESAVADLLRRSGVEADYAALDEDARLALLTRELQNPRPFIRLGGDVDADTDRVLAPLRVAKAAIEAEPESIGSYIISMTDAVSDVLEVLLLAKEVGLWRMTEGVVESPLDVAPLLETIADLEAGPTLLASLFENEVYAAHLAARGRMQEVMLGYSDSNKDGGYWQANWSLHKAQGAIAETCRDAGVDLRYFHGRGGTVGRGGGRAGQAIRAIPPAAQTGRIRFTEQGEVISFRYALPGIARRHLEQIVHAQLTAVAEADRQRADPRAEAHDLMERLADRSMEAYRALIDAPEFWPWYSTATPIAHIARLSIASRPISRKGMAELDFEGLRAIPWVFSWTQPRFTAPGWYGVGTALAEAITGDDLPTLRQLQDRWPFFQAVAGNTLREMARARLAIGRRYSALAESAGASRQPFEAVETEFARAEAALLRVVGRDTLLDPTRAIAATIRYRNPATDVLNLIQLDLLRRWRSGADGDDTARALLLSVNAIAAAMQSTG
ncbi:MAG: phosphoenolpyruvate carboxylase [Bacteroidota bacterium]